jgi:hypothetical protein
MIHVKENWRTNQLNEEEKYRLFRNKIFEKIANNGLSNAGEPTCNFVLDFELKATIMKYWWIIIRFALLFHSYKAFTVCSRNFPTFLSSKRPPTLRKLEQIKRVTFVALREDSNLVSFCQRSGNDGQVDSKMSNNTVSDGSFCPTFLPSGDSIDKKIFQLALPAVMHYSITPLVGAISTFWIGRMKDAAALAGQVNVVTFTFDFFLFLFCLL